VDILLTDVRMTDMNGVELYRLTRKTNPKLTTILMTAYAADDIIQLWQKASRMTSINISTKDAKTNVMILIISQ
jgi:DNA-binding NtrC family response regulator